MGTKPTEINYIKEKQKKSLIIETGNEHTVIVSSSNIQEIKNTISAILDCTDLYEKIKIEANWRKIFSLNEEITKHIFSSISNTFNLEEKKQILKEQLKNIINSKNNIIIFFRNKKIYIIDTWKEEIKSKTITQNKRYDWYTDEEVDFLIKENLWKKYDSKEILIDLLDNINFKKLNRDQALNFVTKEYKGYLLNWYINKLNKSYKISPEITKAIAWRLLRKNFLLAKEYIINQYFYEKLKNLLENKITKETIEIEINETIKKFFVKEIKDENFDLNSIKYLENKYNDIVKKIIKEILDNENIKLDDFQIDKIAKEIIKTVLNKKRKDIQNFVYEIITTNIIEKLNSKDKIINKNITSIFIYLANKQTDIYINSQKKNYDIAKFTSTFRALLSEQEENKRKLKLINNRIKSYNIDKKTSIENIENQLNKNISEVSRLFNLLNGWKESYNSVTIEDLKEKIQSLRNQNQKNSQLIKKLSSNIVSEKLYYSKIKKLKTINENNSKKIEYILKIIQLKNKDIILSNKIKELKNKKQELNKLKNDKKEIEENIEINEKYLIDFKQELQKMLQISLSS